MPSLEYSRLIKRVVLSAPSKAHEVRVVNQVILAVSALSIAGAGWIIMSFCLFKQVRTFRHQLILGLAISDFWMAVNFLSSCAMNLSGRSIGDPSQKRFCSFNGFMTQFFVIQTDYWVLLIAVCTFLILANHKHMSSWIQEHRLVLWCLPWGFSALWAAIGLGLDGYSDIGAWCWFGSDKTRLLVNFLPRWLIVIFILALYARLYRIIYKAHNRFMSFNDQMSPHNHASPSVEPDTDSPNPMLKKMARQMMSYPLAYMLIWTIPTTIRIYQSVKGKPAPFGIATVDKACIVIQGFVDALIYGVNESSLGVWRERFRRSSPATAAPANIKVNVEHEIRIERTLRSALSDSDSHLTRM
ncbi:hypothetical protein BU26DRAFT_573909 [Trematosphaeria pertusa]|uniref:G-protein coupled receptors family 2 profile 2 domain-containing protein n=1 Tax=Trematosphaeria pertusa TaxID=390896 RepID=A0A6A6J2C7_9PLEO|nr:uncharacterized protein BU26DRAFT_573909 [Trematosphaeria pertusa]KAF2256060.1 hypothetical protein BU26DRAFT_573909 [Trematosphaeria pertusa]